LCEFSFCTHSRRKNKASWKNRVPLSLLASGSVLWSAAVAAALVFPSFFQRNKSQRQSGGDRRTPKPKPDTAYPHATSESGTRLEKPVDLYEAASVRVHRALKLQPGCRAGARAH